MPRRRAISVKRHAAFHDLSRDHHALLMRALELKRGSIEPANVARRLLARSALEHHLAEEETILLPLLEGHPDSGLLGRRLRERNQLLRAACAGLRAPNGAANAAASLHDHARWCEDELFPWMQDHFGERELQALKSVSAALRRQLGAPVGPGEACAL